MRKKAFITLAAATFSLLNSLFAREAGSSPYLHFTATPFEIIRGMVIVQAEIDGEPANFILDTGSPMIILNETVSEKADYQVNGLSGDAAGEWKKVNELTWAGVHKFNLNVLCMDVGHLDYIAGRPIRGLIGYDFFENFDLLLDFEHQILTLVPRGFTETLDGWRLKSVIPFELEGHLAVVNVKIGEQNLRLGLDTGSNTNMLDMLRKGDIDPELITPVGNTGVMGISPETENVFVADIVETSVGGINYWNMRYVFTDISHLQNLKDNKVDGLLGFPFFKSGKFSINYDTKIISIWE